MLRPSLVCRWCLLAIVLSTIVATSSGAHDPVMEDSQLLFYNTVRISAKAYPKPEEDHTTPPDTFTVYEYSRPNTYVLFENLSTQNSCTMYGVDWDFTLLHHAGGTPEEVDHSAYEDQTVGIPPGQEVDFHPPDDAWLEVYPQGNYTAEAKTHMTWATFTWNAYHLHDWVQQ